MAVFDALLTEIAKPAYAGMTDPQILAALNALTVPNPQKAILRASDIVNAIVAADLAAVAATASNLQLILIGLSGGTNIDASPGTTTRLIFQTIFASHAGTLAALAALVTPFDTATKPWYLQFGVTGPLNENDLQAARIGR